MKILFWTHTEWIFAKIHNELVKALYPDIYCDFVSWRRMFSREEIDIYCDKYDFIVSTPEGCFVLNSTYNIPLKKLVAVAHSEWDIWYPIKSMGYNIDNYVELAGYTVISEALMESSINFRIRKIPQVLKVGLFTDNYKPRKRTYVKNIGYYSRLSRIENGVDIKRGNLVKTITESLGMNFIYREDVDYHAMDHMYQDIDIYMFASLNEGNPYAALEALSCGIPVIGTSVGIFKNFANTGCCFVLPMEENAFIKYAVEKINLLREDDLLYNEMSKQAIKQSKTFDWSVLRKDWIRFFRGL